jgi:hypothetical protein
MYSASFFSKGSLGIHIVHPLICLHKKIITADLLTGGLKTTPWNTVGSGCHCTLTLYLPVLFLHRISFLWGDQLYFVIPFTQYSLIIQTLK